MIVKESINMQRLVESYLSEKGEYKMNSIEDRIHSLTINRANLETNLFKTREILGRSLLEFTFCQVLLQKDPLLSSQQLIEKIETFLSHTSILNFIKHVGLDRYLVTNTTLKNSTYYESVLGLKELKQNEKKERIMG
jgi:hypothetical protein